MVRYYCEECGYTLLLISAVAPIYKCLNFLCSKEHDRRSTINEKLTTRRALNKNKFFGNGEKNPEYVEKV